MELAIDARRARPSGVVGLRRSIDMYNGLFTRPGKFFHSNLHHTGAGGAPGCNADRYRTAAPADAPAA